MLGAFLALGLFWGAWTAVLPSVQLFVTQASSLRVSFFVLAAVAALAGAVAARVRLA